MQTAEGIARICSVSDCRTVIRAFRQGWGVPAARLPGLAARLQELLDDPHSDDRLVRAAGDALTVVRQAIASAESQEAV